MCDICGDVSHRGDLTSPDRRKALLGGAGLVAAAPFLTGLAASAQTQNPGASAGSGPWRVRAYGNKSASGPFEAIEIPRRALRPNDVLIDIMYCAICHSDIH
ncbi:hypothetical protein O4J55_28575, partial [Paracoccus sp. PXZ]